MAEDLPGARARELSLAEARAEALANVPAYGGEPLRQLPGGSVNRSYEVTTPSGSFVVRVSPEPDAWLTSDRRAELQLHACAGSAGLAPGIVSADPKGRWLVTEWVAGSLWTDAHFGVTDALGRLGVTLRRLHAIPPPPLGHFDLLGTLEKYAGEIELRETQSQAEPQASAGDSGGKGNEGTAFAVPITQLRGWVAAAEEAWLASGAGKRSLAIVHHDLHASNLIESPAGLVLIDWECAAVSDPLLDVACVLSYYELAGDQAAALLSHSGLQQVGPSQLAASIWLFELHSLLWYRHRRQHLIASKAELAAERRLALRIGRGFGPGSPAATGASVA